MSDQNSGSTEKSTDQPVTKEHLAAIGQVITSWSVCESTLRMLAHALTTNTALDETDDATAAVVFQGMQARTLVGILQSLVQMRFPDDTDKMKKLGEKLLKAKAARDVFAHSIFEHGPEPGTIHPIHAKTVGGIKAVTNSFSVKEINLWAETIAELSIQTVACLVRWNYLSAPESSPEIPDEPDQP